MAIYAQKLNGGHADNFRVTTPNGKSITFDAAMPWGGDEIVVIEAKTGCEWANNPKANPKWIASRDEQFEAQLDIATTCVFNYMIAVNNASGARGLKDRLPRYAGYITFIP